MARELEPLDVTDTPEVRTLAEEVARTGVPRILKRDGADLAVVSPVPSGRGKRSLSQPSQSGSPNRWLEDLIGIGESSEPADVSGHVHAYVARALHAETDKTTS